MYYRKESIQISCIISFFILIMAQTTQAQSKSLYAISQHFSTTIKSYKIEGDQIIYQTDAQGVPEHEYGAVDLAIDPESYYLFVTYEGSETL